MQRLFGCSAERQIAISSRFHHAAELRLRSAVGVAVKGSSAGVQRFRTWKSLVFVEAVLQLCRMRNVLLNSPSVTVIQCGVLTGTQWQRTSLRYVLESFKGSKPFGWIPHTSTRFFYTTVGLAVISRISCTNPLTH